MMRFFVLPQLFAIGLGNLSSNSDSISLYDQNESSASKPVLLKRFLNRKLMGPTKIKCTHDDQTNCVEGTCLDGDNDACPEHGEDCTCTPKIPCTVDNEEDLCVAGTCRDANKNPPTCVKGSEDCKCNPKSGNIRVFEAALVITVTGVIYLAVSLPFCLLFLPSIIAWIFVPLGLVAIVGFGVYFFWTLPSDGVSYWAFLEKALLGPFNFIYKQIQKLINLLFPPAPTSPEVEDEI